MFLSLLDMCKAFDYVNCWKLFNKTLNQGCYIWYIIFGILYLVYFGILPRNVVSLSFYWYANEAMFVQWQNYFSDKFNKYNGERQKSSLSPFLLSLYIDDTLQGIHNCNVGCKLFGVRANVLEYADDIVLLAPLWLAL